MAYCIRYEKRKSKLTGTFRQVLFTVLFFFAFVYCTFQSDGDAIWGALSDAAENMVCQLQDCGDMADAVAAFCREVIYD